MPLSAASLGERRPPDVPHVNNQHTVGVCNLPSRARGASTIVYAGLRMGKERKPVKGSRWLGLGLRSYERKYVDKFDFRRKS